jgi:hypothetical protein
MSFTTTTPISGAAAAVIFGEFEGHMSRLELANMLVYLTEQPGLLVTFELTGVPASPASPANVAAPAARSDEERAKVAAQRAANKARVAELREAQRLRASRRLQLASEVRAKAQKNC